MAASISVKRPAPKRGAGTVLALERGIALLGCFEPGCGALSNGELSRRTGIPKPTLTRLTATLVSLGLLKQVRGDDRYELAAGVLSFAQAFLGGLDIRAQARPHMVELAESLGASVYLAVCEGIEMVLIETCRSSSTVLHSRLDVGSRLQIPNSALGRAYAAALEPIERKHLLDRMCAQYTKRGASSRAEWARLPAEFDQALEQGRAQGFCTSMGAWHPDIHSIAVPLRSANAQLFAINCGGPAFAFSADRLQQAGPRLLGTARAIARDIGGSVPDLKTSGASAGPRRAPYREARA